MCATLPCDADARSTSGRAHFSSSADRHSRRANTGHCGVAKAEGREGNIPIPWRGLRGVGKVLAGLGTAPRETEIAAIPQLSERNRKVPLLLLRFARTLNENLL